MRFYSELPEEAERSLDEESAFEVKMIAARNVDLIKLRLSQMGERD
jgi:hypothetical protein